MLLSSIASHQRQHLIKLFKPVRFHHSGIQYFLMILRTVPQVVCLPLARRSLVADKVSQTVIPYSNPNSSPALNRWMYFRSGRVPWKSEGSQMPHQGSRQTKGQPGLKGAQTPKASAWGQSTRRTGAPCLSRRSTAAT